MGFSFRCGALQFLLPALVLGTVTTSVTGVTSTQAIINISLSAPTGAACPVEISESPPYTPLVNDVDGAKYPGANLTSRPGTIVIGNQIRFVAGTRAPQSAASGGTYSRALAAGTVYYYRVNNGGACDSSGAATGIFVTGPVVNRQNHDAIPGDWMHFYGQSASPIVDPFTGVKIVPLNIPGENISTVGAGGLTSYPYFGPVSAKAFDSVFDPTSTWGTSGPYTLATSSQNPLVSAVSIPEISNSWKGTYESVSGDSLDYVYLHVTGFDAAGDQGSACLSTGGGTNRCDSPKLLFTFPTTSQTFNIGGTTPGLSDWGSFFTGLDPVLASLTTGYVTQSGAVLQWVSLKVSGQETSNFFRPQTNGWGAGTRILLTGGTCSNAIFYAASAPTSDNGTITLTGTPSCGTSSLQYSVTPLTVLIGRNSASSGTINISALNFDYETDFGQASGSSAMQDGYLGCSPAAVTTVSPTGYICGSAVGYYLVQPTIPARTFIGRIIIPYGIPSGTSHTTEDVPPLAFDPTNPKHMYGVVPGFGFNTYVFDIVYTGNFTTPDPATTHGVLPICNGSNAPCITITGPIGGDTLENQLATSSFSGLLNDCCWKSFSQLGAPGIGQTSSGTIQLQASLGTQNTTAIFAVFDPVAGHFVAGRDTWSYWPIIGGVHSTQLRRGTQIGIPLGDVGNWPNGEPGPLSGTETVAGNGPYLAHTASLMTSIPCPTRSGSDIIPAIFWPSGSSNPGHDCWTFTVDAGWCDPSPGQPHMTITTVLGSGAATIPNGDAIRPYKSRRVSINGSVYTITAVADSQNITISPVASAAGTFDSVVQGEPYATGAGGPGDCSSSSQFFLRNAGEGDIIFPGAPTPNVVAAANSSGYETYQATNTAGWHEPFLILARSGSVIVAQGSYDGSAHKAWPIGTTLYLDSGVFIGESATVQYDFPWNPADATGSLAEVGYDPGIPGVGHGFMTDYAQYLYSNQGSNNPCPSSTTDWFNYTTISCMVGKYGQNLGYISAPQKVIAYTAPFAGFIGSGLTNNLDVHPSAPYWSQPQFGVTAHIWNGTTNQPALGTDTGGGVWKFSWSQRGCSSSAQCIALEKALPVQVNCGNMGGINLSQTTIGNTITTSSPYCGYQTVVNAGEGISTSLAGDLIVYCPRCNGTSHDSGISSGGDYLSIGATFAGPLFEGTSRDDFSNNCPLAKCYQWLGHSLIHFLHTPFFNARGTPDNEGIIVQVPLLDGSRTVNVMIRAGDDPTRISDAVSTTDFVSINLNVSPPASANAVEMQFGYDEFGDPASGPYCTPRQETCVRGGQAPVTGQAHPYSFAGETFSAASCTGSCVVSIPALSQRVLYYRLVYLNGASVVARSNLDVMATP